MVNLVFIRFLWTSGQQSESYGELLATNALYRALISGIVFILLGLYDKLMTSDMLESGWVQEGWQGSPLRAQCRTTTPGMIKVVLFRMDRQM
jgi:hypothetical protein